MSIEEEIDKVFGDYNKPGMPGAAVMVIQKGKIIFDKGYGLAEVEKNVRVTNESNFRLASVTKQFTAMSILLLISRSKLEMGTTLKDIFPEYPEYGSAITIRNLLQHTSGLIDYEDLIPEGETIQLKDKDVLKLMMNTDSTYFKPGDQHKYSNTGYALLALTIEKLSNQPFRDFLKENIFDPLGMENTIAFEQNINEVKNRAYGYNVENGSIGFTDQSVTSAVLGDGGIYSSLTDLLKWDQSLYTDKLIEKKHLDESWSAGKTNKGEEFPYGYGWHLENYSGSDVVYHTGSTRGFRNIIYRVPEKNFTIIILTNRDAGPESRTLDFAHKIYNICNP
jgi:CubicO group peptidase (beta-lactamase class C family)